MFVIICQTALKSLHLKELHSPAFSVANIFCTCNGVHVSISNGGTVSLQGRKRFVWGSR